MNTFRKLSVAILCSVLLLSGCASTSLTNNMETIANETTSYGSISVDYSNFDLDTSTTNASTINLDSVDGTLEITAAGTYILQGTLEGNIVVNVVDSEKVHLIFNGVTITSSTKAPIEVVSADKVSITLMEDTVNTINDTGVYDEANEDTRAKAAIYSASSLTINGEGTLIVNADYNNGIATKKNLKVISGTIVVNAANNGLKGNNSVVVKDGALTITSVNDGIKAEETEDTTKGYIYVEGGTITITSSGDGLDASQYVIITDGTLNITTNGEVTASGSNSMDVGFGGGKMGGMNFDGSNAPTPPDSTSDFTPSEKPDMSNDSKENQKEFPFDVTQIESMLESATLSEEDSTTIVSILDTYNSDGEVSNEDLDKAMRILMKANEAFNEQSEDANDESNDSVSSKGIKADSEVYISGGTITINSTDHTIKSGGTLTIDGGTFTLASSSCKGITAINDLTITNGDITITKSYEGLESKSGGVYISGGSINIQASDDGINCSNSDGTISISDGNVEVHADGDGLDSNNTITITGGTITVDGPAEAMNSALDSDKGITIDGGSVIAYGSNGMVETPEESSAQNFVVISFTSTYKAGTTFKVVNSSGDTVVSFTNEKSISAMIFSNANLAEGDYTVYADDEAVETFTISSTSTVVGTVIGMGGMMGSPNGFSRDDSNESRPQRPDSDNESSDSEKSERPNTSNAPSDSEKPQRPTGDMPSQKQ